MNNPAIQLVTAWMGRDRWKRQDVLLVGLVEIRAWKPFFSNQGMFYGTNGGSKLISVTTCKHQVTGGFGLLDCVTLIVGSVADQRQKATAMGSRNGL